MNSNLYTLLLKENWDCSKIMLLLFHPRNHYIWSVQTYLLISLISKEENRKIKVNYWFVIVFWNVTVIWYIAQSRSEIPCKTYGGKQSLVFWFYLLLKSLLNAKRSFLVTLPPFNKLSHFRGNLIVGAFLSKI